MRPAMIRPWDQEERAWALECLGAGDTAEEIAVAADRTVEDVKAALADLPTLTSLQRRVANCISAGMTCTETDQALNAARGTAWSCVRRIRAKGFNLPLPGRAPVAAVAEAARYGFGIEALAERFAVSRRTIERRLEARRG